MIDTAALIAATTFRAPKERKLISLAVDGYTEPQEREVRRISADGNYALITYPWRNRRSYTGALRVAAGEWVELPFNGGYGTKIAEVVERFAHLTGQLAQLAEPLVVKLDADQSELYRRVSELRNSLRDDKGELLTAYDIRQISYSGFGVKRDVAKLYERLLNQLQVALKATHSHPYAEKAVSATINASPYQVNPFTITLAQEQAVDLDAEHASAIAVVEAAQADAARARDELTALRVELQRELVSCITNEATRTAAAADKLAALQTLALSDVEAAAQEVLDGTRRITQFGADHRSSHRVAEDMARIDSELELIANDPQVNTVLAELVSP